MASEKKPKGRNPVVNVFATEWKYLGKRKKIFVFYAFFFLIAGLISLMTPLVIGLIFNTIQQEITSDAELRSLIYMIFLLLAITIGFWIFHGTARILEEKTGFFVKRNYVNSKIFKILDLPVKWHKDHHSGDTIDKINRGSNAMSDFSRGMTFEIFYGIINIVGSLIILLFIDVRAATVALLFSVIVIFAVMRFDKKLNEQYRELNKYSNKVAAAVHDYVSNIITVITLRLKKSVRKEVDARIMASYELEKKNVVLNEFKWGFANIAIELMVVLVLAWRAYTDYNTTGIILIGTLYILYGYLERVGSTFNRFAYLYGNIVRKDARVVGAYPIDEAYEEVGKESRATLPLGWRNISLKNVSFTHTDKDQELHLDNVNFSFKAGQKIALVGESGSGKSTLVALIRGLGKPESGEVYSGNKLLENGFARLKHHVTLIPQEPEIFNNTIKYNITMDIQTRKEDLDEAVKIAQFKKVVDRLQKGLNSNVLEKGVSLSGGEKQRLALARGILAAKGSDIVLMDEPTSSVDTLNELMIYDNIFKKFKDKTIISSVHRLHLLEKFDYIYLFDKGKIIAEGTLEDIKSNPAFKVSWKKYKSG
jgi:ATP-binding cassette, subfamily B, bacterial